MKPKLIQSQIKSLEAQLEVLKAKVKHVGETAEEYSFASLYGILQGKSNSTFDEIKEAEYKLKWETED